MQCEWLFASGGNGKPAYLDQLLEVAGACGGGGVQDWGRGKWVKAVTGRTEQQLVGFAFLLELLLLSSAWLGWQAQFVL